MPSTAESPQITAARQFTDVLQSARWQGGVRVVIQGSMRALTSPGQVDLESGWRADVFYGKARKPSFVLIADTPAKLLRDLAALTEDIIEDA